MKVQCSLLAGMAMLGVAMSFPAQAVEQWKLTILPTIEGGQLTSANDINNLGQIIGMANTPTGSSALSWIDGSLHILPVPDGTVQAQPLRINSSGISVGGSLKSDGIPLPVRWTGTNQVAYVGGGAGLPSAFISDINDLGDAVGSFGLRPYLFRGDSAIPLALLPDQLNSSAEGVSNAGIIGGSGLFQLPPEEMGDPPIFASRGIIWNSGVPTRQGILPGYFGGFVETVNDDGLAGGHVETDGLLAPYSYRAVLYQNGEAVDFLAGKDGIGLYSSVVDLNNRGDAVGFTDASGAFLYRDGQLVFLNDLPEVQQSGWILRAASGINDRGQIVGWGHDAQGVSSAFLLTPVPEPEITMLLVAGLSVLVIARRRLMVHDDANSA